MLTDIFETLITPSFFKLSKFSQKLIKDEIGTFDKLQSLLQKVNNDFFKQKFKMTTILLAANSVSLYEIVSNTKYFFFLSGTQIPELQSSSAQGVF